MLSTDRYNATASSRAVAATCPTRSAGSVTGLPRSTVTMAVVETGRRLCPRQGDRRRFDRPDQPIAERGSSGSAGSSPRGSARSTGLTSRLPVTSPAGQQPAQHLLPRRVQPARPDRGRPRRHRANDRPLHRRRCSSPGRSPPDAPGSSPPRSHQTPAERSRSPAITPTGRLHAGQARGRPSQNRDQNRHALTHARDGRGRGSPRTPPRIPQPVRVTRIPREIDSRASAVSGPGTRH